jgi:hypothetical protein
MKTNVGRHLRTKIWVFFHELHRHDENTFVTKEQLKTAIEEALAQTITATTKSTVLPVSQPDVAIIDKNEWKDFKRRVRALGWKIHPSVNSVDQRDCVPFFDVHEIVTALEGRIAFTQRILIKLGEEPEGCCKYLAIHPSAI